LLINQELNQELIWQTIIRLLWWDVCWAPLMIPLALWAALSSRGTPLHSWLCESYYTLLQAAARMIRDIDPQVNRI